MMRDFEIRIKENELEPRNLLDIMKNQIKELCKLGFNAAVVEEKEEYHLIIIDGNGEVYADIIDDESAIIAPSMVEWLARFVESASVQKALDSMLPRMMRIGWKSNIHYKSAVGKSVISVIQPNGCCTTYDLVNTDMLTLRLALDIAEVDWLLNNAMPLFLRAEWRLVRNANGTYTMFKPNGYDVIEVGDVAQVHYLVNEVKEKLRCSEP